MAKKAENSSIVGASRACTNDRSGENKYSYGKLKPIDRIHI